MGSELIASGRFENKVVVVTAAGSGMGAACACKFAAEGAWVVMSDVDAEAGKAVCDGMENERVSFVHGDVTDRLQVEELIRGAVDRHGRIDILHNHAGLAVLGEIDEVSADQWSRCFAVTIDSVFYGCRTAIPFMREQGAGVIVNTASTSGLHGDLGLSVYNAAKAAVINFTRSLAASHARDGIRINAVCPGPIEGQSLNSALGVVTAPLEAWQDAIPMGRLGKETEVADAVAFLASDAASFITGHALVVDGGMSTTSRQPVMFKPAMPG